VVGTAYLLAHLSTIYSTPNRGSNPTDSSVICTEIACKLWTTEIGEALRMVGII
jgi:hypothetical protein